MDKNTKKNSRQIGAAALIVLLLVGLDQLTKAMAVSGLKGKDDIILFPGVLQLHYLENQSAAFSMDPISLVHRIFNISYFTENPDSFLMAKMIFFAVLTILVILLMAVVYVRIPQNKHFLPMNLVLIGFVAGAIGNLIDRVINHYVVDFIYFSLIDFPVFNVADIYVTCAAFCFVIVSIWFYKEEDFALILSSGKKSEESAL